MKRLLSYSKFRDRLSGTILLLVLSFLFPTLSFAQGVHGRVVDETNGTGLPGVTVIVAGQTKGTSTDSEGVYALGLAPGDYKLRFSFIGFTTVERTVSIGADSLDVSIQLSPAQTSLNEVVVVGTRNLNRSVTDSPSPIDIIDVRQVTTKTGQLDVNQLLQYVAPSFNSNRQTGSDGADHVDPATLRGLGPDQTLVLVNGKRRHQSALVNMYGSRGRGNAGTDLNAIPAAAIERIEILRDGAAAQYGSDAIAGVINIVLKSNVNELTGNLNYGTFKALYRFDDKAFDGGNTNVNANYGWRLGTSGFLNVTGDYNFRGHTQRANVPGDIIRRQYGDPQMQNTSTYLNAQIPVSTKTNLYAFGGINLRKGDAFATTRFADSPRNIPEIYPDGFDPIITSKITDASFAAGVRSKLGGWDVDLGNVFGSNRFHYGVRNTLNASMGIMSPREFDAGGFQLQQNVTGLHVTRNFQQALHGLNVAFGSEFRVENYQIFAGEEASYKNYDPEKAGGAQGFPGFQPGDVVNKSRSNLGVYLDTEVDLTRAFMVGAAVRFENYSDFGSTLNGKLTSRLKLNENWMLRGTLSTGFRAPSLAQIYFNSTITNIVGGQPVEMLLARNDSPVTQKLGIPALKQETSSNASAGVTGRLGSSLSLTIDGYYIKVRDRVVLTGPFTADDPDIGADLAALHVGQAQFFTNAISTSTRGLDVILAHTAQLGRGRLNTTLAGNLNKLTIDAVQTNDRLKGKEDTYFDERERHFVQASAPPSKVNLTVDYAVNRWNVLLRFVRFDRIKLVNFGLYDSEVVNAGQQYNIYDPRVTTDLTIGYRFSKQVGLNIGVSNLFNVYPNKQDPTLTETGGAWEPVQMGSNGAFLFGKLTAKF